MALIFKMALVLTFDLAVINPNFVKISFMGIWNQFAEYLFIKKKDPKEKPTQWMKYMHGMNRISLMMFLVAILIILFKIFLLPHFKS
jgi:hypothetical protein